MYFPSPAAFKRKCILITLKFICLLDVENGLRDIANLAAKRSLFTIVTHYPLFFLQNFVDFFTKKEFLSFDQLKKITH